MTLTDMGKLVQSNILQIKEMVNYNMVHAENIQTHIKAIQDLSKGVNALIKAVNKLSEKY